MNIKNILAAIFTVWVICMPQGIWAASPPTPQDASNANVTADKANSASDPTDTNSLPPKGTYYEYDELGRIKKIIRIK